MADAPGEAVVRAGPRARLRGACRLAAALWVGLSILFVAQPPGLAPGISFPIDLTVGEIAAFWDAQPHRSLPHVALHLTALATAAVMIAVVTAVRDRLRPAALWSSGLAMLALATTAISNARYLAMERTYARLFAEVGAAGQAEVAVASASLALDPYGILEFGLLAFWVVSVTRHAGPRRPRTFTVAAGVAGLGLAGMVVGAVGWSPALDVAPLLGTPGLVAWLLLLPGALEGGEPPPPDPVALRM